MLIALVRLGVHIVDAREVFEQATAIKNDDEIKTIPVVAVTAFAMKGDEEKFRAGGCEAYIAKPISVAQFVDTVKRFVA